MQIMDRSSLLYWYGVEIGEGAVVGATASVYKSVEPWSVVGGNPCKIIKMRKLTNIKSGGGNF